MARTTEPILLTHRDGRKYTTTDPREANDLIMLRGWRRVVPPVPESTTTAEEKAEGKADEKVEEKPDGKAGQKPANKARTAKGNK